MIDVLIVAACLTGIFVLARRKSAPDRREQIDFMMWEIELKEEADL